MTGLGPGADRPTVPSRHVRGGRAALGALLLPVALAGCDYVRLLRPGVLKQLDPRVVRLVNEFPSVDHPNEDVIARLPGHGGLARAVVGADGVMRATVRVPEGQLIWEPSVVVAPRGGDLELDFSNEDAVAHGAMVEGVDGEQVLPLPVHTRGRVRIRLTQPGLYKYTCPVANHGMRGMLGLILVGGEVPDEARLDRPAQLRPGRTH